MIHTPEFKRVIQVDENWFEYWIDDKHILKVFMIPLLSLRIYFEYYKHPRDDRFSRLTLLSWHLDQYFCYTYELSIDQCMEFERFKEHIINIFESANVVTS